MAEVVTLAEAKVHLRVTTSLDDADITDKLEAATAIVIDYLARRDTTWNAEMEAWTAATVPKSVRAAILIQLAELYRMRGDDPVQPSQQAGTTGLSPTVKALVGRYRDPGVA